MTKLQKAIKQTEIRWQSVLLDHNLPEPCGFCEEFARNGFPIDEDEDCVKCPIYKVEGKSCDCTDWLMDINYDHYKYTTKEAISVYLALMIYINGFK